MGTLIRTKDLCKTYIVNKQSNNVLQNVNLTVDEGEFVSVMGPSGSGKSTLLYTVSGMDNVTVTCNGQLLGCQMLGCFSTDAVKLGFAKAWGEWPYTVRLPEVNPECAACPDMHFCTVCPGVRMAECGNLNDKPKYICRQTKLLASRKGENLL